MIEVCAYRGGYVEVGGYSGEESFGDVAEFGVGVLGVPDEDVEGAVGGDAVDEHEHAFGLFDRSAGGGEVGDDVVDCFGDGGVDGVGDVDVEAGAADDLTVLVEDAVADDDDRAGVPFGVDDAVAAAECSAGGADRVQGVGDVGSVVGVLVGEKQFGGRGDGGGVVSVHAGDGVGPFPSVAVAVVEESSDSVWGTGFRDRL